MKPVRRAVIDVGTNSVKLLVADVDGRVITPVHEESTQTRLGRGFYDAQQLQPEAIKATADAIAAFADTARQRGAVSMRVIATSAAREAKNGRELTDAIAYSSGLRVEVISGDQEADLGFQGVTTDAVLAATPLLLMDVGGGSTEFILGHGDLRIFQKSFPLGTVRLLERQRLDDPPVGTQLSDCQNGVRQFLREKVRPELESAMAGEREFAFVGVGGTASILACMEARLDAFDRARVEATRLSAEQVTWHVNRLWGAPLEERKQITGLPKNRADVILTGVVIYEQVMREFGLRELRVSTRGLRFAALMVPA